MNPDQPKPTTGEQKFSGGTRLDCGTFIPPKPTGEWTVEGVAGREAHSLLHYGSESAYLLHGDAEAIADAHNAALAAEENKRADWNVVIEDLEKQLASEREKVKVANTQCKTIAALMQDAEQQLAAEQDASRYWKEQWVERGAQLAAHKQQAESMLATSKRVNDQLRSQVQPLVDALTEIRDRLKSPDVDVDFEWILEKSETALAKVKEGKE